MDVYRSLMHGCGCWSPAVASAGFKVCLGCGVTSNRWGVDGAICLNSGAIQLSSTAKLATKFNINADKWIVMGWWSRNVPSRYTAYDSKRRSTNFRKQAKLQRTRRCTKRGCLISRKQLLPLHLENCNFLISESSTEGWGGQGQKVTWQPGSQGHGTRKPALGSRDYGHPQFKTNWTMIQELSWCSRPFTSFVSP